MSKGKNNPPPRQHHLSDEEFLKLQDRVQENKLTDQDRKIILGVLSFNKWMHERLGRAKLTIKRLRQLFGFKNEARQKKKKPKDDQDNPTNPDDEHAANENKISTDIEKPTDSNDAPENTNKISVPQWNDDANHGRLGVDAYPGCSELIVSLKDELLLSGQCPSCAACNTLAHVSPVPPTVLIFLEGQPLITGQRVALEKVRCNVCQEYFTASLPEDFTDRPKYPHTCSTSIAIHHYHAGLPFYRIENLQSAQGVPVPDATQYDLMAKLYESCIRHVVEVLRYQAANGSAQFFDDTTGRIIEQTIANKQAKNRSDKASIHTTALISLYKEHRIYLFDTNTKTAGKQFSKLLEQRDTDDEFITMSDALPANFPILEESLLARWVIRLCLAHGRRRFVELIGDDQDEDINFVLDQIGQIYENEQYCKTQKLSDEARLLYHQTHSASVIEALRIWFNNLLLYKNVEPNSRFGEAITYMLKRWHWLTQFLRVAGSALDNNICEQAIKVAILYRKNSLFYRTFYGASVGDAIMSVLHTAAYANVNIFDYLNALQIHQKAVGALLVDRNCEISRRVFSAPAFVSEGTSSSGGGDSTTSQNEMVGSSCFWVFCVAGVLAAVCFVDCVLFSGNNCARFTSY